MHASSARRSSSLYCGTWKNSRGFGNRAGIFLSPSFFHLPETFNPFYVHFLPQVFALMP
ncbi:hypothetical protein PUN28_000643 [Cardiocondyla obscurior]|uniref:Uncharacterized protein n=1 Tax=Cardiocondyla obscurior TaxID=286306 RepID=A0AAW2H0G3_9HYME